MAIRNSGDLWRLKLGGALGKFAIAAQGVLNNARSAFMLRQMMTIQVPQGEGACSFTAWTSVTAGGTDCEFSSALIN